MSKQTNLLLSKQHLHSAVLKPQGSKNFLKQIVPLCVSFILHQRVEFDGKNFQTATYDGIKFQAFKPKLQNATLIDVRSGITSAMKVLDKNYLRELYLILANVNDSTIFYESYKFQFNYLRGEGFHIDISSTENTLGESTNSLFNAIDSLNHHTKYKEDELDIKLAITYYEDIMPVDYIPEGFRNDDESAAELQKLIKAQPSDYLILGVLKSGHHVLKCRAKGEVFSMRDSTHPSMEEVNNDETTTLEVQNTPERELQYTPVENDIRYSPIPIDYELSPSITSDDDEDEVQFVSEYNRCYPPTSTVSPLSEVITVEDDEDELDNYQKHEVEYDDHSFSASTVLLLYPNDEEVIDNFDDILLEGSLEDENDIPPSKRSPDITSITKKYVQPIPEFYSGICDRFRTSDHAVIQKHLKTQEHCKSFVEVANKQYKRINDEQNTAADRHAKKRKARNEAILKEKPQTEDSEKEGAADHKVITVEDDEDELDNYPKHEVQNDQKRELIGFEENETMSQNDDHCFSDSTVLLLYPNDEEVIDNFDDILLEGSLEDENDIPPSKRSPDITSITKKYVQPIPEFYSGICDRFRTSDHAVIQKHLKTQEHCKSFVEVANKQYKRINDEQNTAADRHAKKRKARNEAILKEKPQTEDSEKEGAADHKVITVEDDEDELDNYPKHEVQNDQKRELIGFEENETMSQNDDHCFSDSTVLLLYPNDEEVIDNFDDILLEGSLEDENDIPPSKRSPDITSITKKYVQPIPEFYSGICDRFRTSDHAVIQKHLKTQEHCKSFVEVANKQYKRINDEQNTAADRHAKKRKARNEAILKEKPQTEDSEKEGAADHKVEEDEAEVDNYQKHEVQNEQERELISFVEKQTVSEYDGHCFSASTVSLLSPSRAPIHEEVIDGFDDLLLKGSLQVENDIRPSNRSPDITIITTKKHVEPIPEFYSGICDRFRTSYHAVIQKHMKTEEHCNSFVNVANKQYKRINDGQNTAANKPKTEDSEKEGAEADPADRTGRAPIEEGSLQIEDDNPIYTFIDDLIDLQHRTREFYCDACNCFMTSDRAVIQEHLKTEEHYNSFVNIAKKQYKRINDAENAAAGRAKNRTAGKYAVLKKKPKTDDSEKEDLQPAGYKEKGDVMYDDEEASEVSLYYFNLDEEVDCL